MKAATAVSALALTVGGMAATAAPAEAVGGCPSGKLCLYRGTNYSDLFFTMASTQACLPINHGGGRPLSYVNNLPVEVKMWGYEAGFPYHTATIRAGGFSSSAGGSTYSWLDACTGGVVPN
ncbi:peptidase inhibitor family I36 protein [Streptomyces sp. NPDC052179]|uniref:peptidase inhibitor family I36 protein n=1 Tax=Streptomyces sp. NPDC052179 TaxID=3155680 RepID=UPI00342FF13D